MKILCVDDEPVVLMSLKMQLKQYFGEKVSVETAQSGPEAIELLDFLERNGALPGLIISDQSMPEMKGTEFLKYVQQKFPQIFKILLTGYLYAEEEPSIEENRVFRCFAKPWDVESLNLAIKKCIQFNNSN